MKKSFFAIIFCALCISACTFEFNKGGQNGSSPDEKPAADAKTNETAAAAENADAKNTEAEKNVFDRAAKVSADCLNIDTGEKKLLKSQTFPVDFPPYKNSCFVTAHDPEYTDPPLDSEFSIYRNGEEIFFFPGQFNGVTTGCWVEAVSFQDLNGDKLTDIIVVGKCSAKTAPYHENMVYVNTGTTFMTDAESNYKLADFQKIKDITDFVRRNKQLFF